MLSICTGPTPGGPALAIVGARILTSAIACFAVWEAIQRHHPAAIISGGALGIDTIAAMWADALGIPKDVRKPKRERWGGEGGYKERNVEIVERCDYLVRVAIPRMETWGSGWTLEYAKSLGKPTESVIIDGERWYVMT